MRAYRFTVTEHHPDRPWLVLGVEQQLVELDENYAWAHEQWASSRFIVQLDPWQLKTS